MADQNQGALASKQAVEKKAIMVSQNVLRRLKTSLSQNSPSVDRLPSDRVLLDDVVNKMMETTSIDRRPVYFAGTRGTDLYKWFDSEVAAKIQINEEIRDKGRFVEACVLLYLYGPNAKKYVRPSREIRPRALSEEQKTMIERTLSEMKDEKSTSSQFVPTTETVGLPS